MDSTRGHGLDQAWNQLGNTGWDLLEYILNGKIVLTRHYQECITAIINFTIREKNDILIITS